MSGDGPLLDLLHRRRDRAIAAILGVKEREADPFLSPEASRRLRKAVLDQLNDFTGMVADLLASVGPEGDDGAVVLNEHWLAKLGEIHDVVVAGAGNGNGRGGH